ncbi:MAG: hypothetical protein NXH86_08965 [Flavobacteriaceae bacterium]|uniref:hypothetical protein n=1 Tax=Flagellimonas TaxID=444459 RepID=UPI0025DD92B7|nr:hypothetical protein [Allomuricauda sp.]MCR9264279.1 hypothetical protein [Flavobacteriaceae bacterium]
MTRIYNTLLMEFKKRQLGYSSIAIIGQSCLGSAAAMVLLMGETAALLKMTLLFFVTIFCMAFNGAVLAQLKPIITFNLLILSIAFSAIVILVHIL